MNHQSFRYEGLRTRITHDAFSALRLIPVVRLLPLIYWTGVI